MSYRLKQWWSWLREFGPFGLFVVLCGKRLGQFKSIRLHSRKYGIIFCRPLIEDIEAVNTVMCFRAYHVAKTDERYATVIDLGGNIGIATRFFLKEVQGCHVKVVEPSLDNYQMLARNVESYGDRVEIIRCAVGQESGYGKIVHDVTGRNDSISIEFMKERPLTGAGSPSVELIEVRSLRDIIGDADGPVLVKMDVEGAEDSILDGREDWSSRVRKVMIEFHDAKIEQKWLDVLRSEKWRAQKHFDTWHFERWA